MAKKSIENRNVTLRQKKDKGPAGREALFQDLPWGPITPLTLAISRRSVVGVVQRARTNMTSIDRCTQGTGSQACRGWGVPRRTICERGGGRESRGTAAAQVRRPEAQERCCPGAGQDGGPSSSTEPFLPLRVLLRPWPHWMVAPPWGGCAARLLLRHPRALRNVLYQLSGHHSAQLS